MNETELKTMKRKATDFMKGVIISTGGDGLCTKKIKPVLLKGCYLSITIYYNNNIFRMSGTLRIEFDRDTWNVENDNYIYTDKTFLKTLNEYLIKNGLSEVDYTEKGIHGWSDICFDVDMKFILLWKNKFTCIHHIDVFRLSNY